MTEAGLVDIVLGTDGEAGFTLSAAITAEGPDAVAALLAAIETPARATVIRRCAFLVEVDAQPANMDVDGPLGAVLMRF